MPANELTSRNALYRSAVIRYAAKLPQRGENAGALSAKSLLSIPGFWSVGSILSFGSILSIGSTGSILSIGSVGSILSLGGAGSSPRPQPKVQELDER